MHHNKIRHLEDSIKIKPYVNPRIESITITDDTVSLPSDPSTPREDASLLITVPSMDREKQILSVDGIIKESLPIQPTRSTVQLSESPPALTLPWYQRTKTFLINHHLPLALALITLFGYLVPAPGKALSKTPINTVSIVGMFFIAGLNLRTTEMKDALKAVPSYVYGFLSILVLSPCLAFLIIRWDLGPIEFARGAAIFIAVPTTASSGVILTAEAGGNVALSILLTVGTNLIGVVTVPFFITAVFQSVNNTGSSTDIRIEIDPFDLLWKLIVSILVPLLIGKAIQYFTIVQTLVKRYKVTLKLLSSAFLMFIPWNSMSVASDLLKDTGTNPVLLVVGVAIGMHILLLLFNYGVCCLLQYAGCNIRLSEQKAVVINSSQKTINTAVAVIALLPLTVGNKGMITVPVIIGHFAQIIIDSLIITYWKTVRENAEEEVVNDKTRLPPISSSSSSGNSSGSSISCSSSSSSSSDINCTINPSIVPRIDKYEK